MFIRQVTQDNVLDFTSKIQSLFTYANGKIEAKATFYI